MTPWPRRGVVGAGVLSLLLAVSSTSGAAPVARASASPASVVATIVATAPTASSAVTTYLFCTTATCKAQRSANAQKAVRGLSTLVGDATKSKTVTSATYASSLGLFRSDVGLVFNAYKTFTTSSSPDQQTQAIGELFFGLAELRSDLSDLGARQHGARPSFVQWAYGISATLYTMRIDFSAISSASATSGSAILANNAIEVEATSLLAHAAGPNASFNRALVTYAHHQMTVSVNENDYIAGVKATITKAQLATLNVTTTNEFNALVHQMTTLAGAKG